MADRPAPPVRVALIDDYEVVLAGLARMLDRFRDRVDVVEITAGSRVDEPVDVALYDTFAQPEPEYDAVTRMVANSDNQYVAVYSWTLRPDLVDAVLGKGATGYLSKGLPAVDLVDALERVAHGETVVSPSRSRVSSADGLDWPGRADGISDRESEILALITQGAPNARIAELTHLSPNTVKTHIRSAYRKIGVATRVEAVIWGTHNGFRPDHRSVDHWLGM